MYDSQEILALLQSGKTPEEIGKQFATALNEAIILDEEEKKKQIQEKELKTKTLDAFRAVIDAMVAYCEVKEKTELAEDMRSKSDDELLELEKQMDSVFELYESLSALTKVIGVKAPKVEVKRVDSRTADEVIADFLKIFD
jgi:hypothetical protein